MAGGDVQREQRTAAAASAPPETAAAAEPAAPAAGAQVLGSLPYGPAVQRKEAGVVQREGEGEPAPYVQPAMGSAPDLSYLKGVPVEPLSTSGVIDVPITELYGRNPPHTPLARVVSGMVLPVKGIIRPAEGEPVYVVEYMGRMEAGRNDQAEPLELLAKLFDLAVSDKGPAQKAPVPASSDWMTLLPEGWRKAPAESKDAVQAMCDRIAQARSGIHKRAAMYVQEKKGEYTAGHKLDTGIDAQHGDDATKAASARYDEWLKTAIPALATGPEDPRLITFRALFPAEGNPAAVMTYDQTNVTWGVGWAGKGGAGVGACEQMMARLFNQDPGSKQAFWDAGVAIDGTDLVVVDLTRRSKLRGIQAEQYYRTQPELLSLMVNVAQGELLSPDQKGPDQHMRQRVLDAQFETFLNLTLRGLDLNSMGRPVWALAAHANHGGLNGGALHGLQTREQAVQEIRRQLKARGSEGLLDNFVRNIPESY